MENYRFYKDDDGWFLYLPESPYTKTDLQMVMGADTFLDIVAQDDKEIVITVSRVPFDGSDTLHYQHQGRLEGPEYGEGAWYFLNEYAGISMSLQIWLCDVTKYLFRDFPIKIYFKRIY